MPGIGWEKCHSTQRVEEFKRCYQDSEIPVRAIAEEFKMSSAAVSATAGRLGLALRRPRAHDNNPDAKPVTLEAIDAEEQDLKRRLFELQQRRADMVVRVERIANEQKYGKDHFAVYGLTAEPFETTAALIQNFLDGQGAGKLRDAVGRKS